MYKLWWSGKSSSIGKDEILVKEELCEKVVNIQRKSDRIMTMVLALGEKKITVLSVNGSQA